MPHNWKAHPFLRELSPEHLETLEACAMITQFERGQVIFRAGEMANCFYLILKGRVAVKNGAPESLVVEHVNSGGVLGWSWLFPPYGLHFTAIAEEPTQAIFFYGTWLRERCEENPFLGYELAKRVMAVMTDRLETLSEQARTLPEFDDNHQPLEKL